jgi:hypothetical protein
MWNGRCSSNREEQAHYETWSSKRSEPASEAGSDRDRQRLGTIFTATASGRMARPIVALAKVLLVVFNVTIRNITGTVNSVGMMDGLVDSPIENVKFENCKITAQKGFLMENPRKVDLSGLTEDVKDGEPITRRNVQ